MTWQFWNEIMLALLKRKMSDDLGPSDARGL